MASSSRSDRDPERPRKSAAAAAPAPSSSARRRSEREMDEEEVGKPSRAARSSSGSSGSGGISLGAKVGLVAASVTLLVLGLAVLPGQLGDKGAATEALFNEAGLAAVNALAAQDNSSWGLGKANAPVWPTLKANIKKLFGEPGETWIKEQEKSLKKPDKEADPDEIEVQAKRAKEFEAALEQLEKGNTDPAERAKRIVQRALRADGGPFDVYAAWVREGTSDKLGAFLAGTHAEAVLVADLSAPDAANRRYVDGTVDGVAVRVFFQSHVGPPGVASTSFVALFRNAPAEGGGGALGWLLLLLGPVAVGFAAALAAGGHAQRVRDLGREIERLGTSGDPTRAIRAHGPEASQVARAVERMVANLEFRQQRSAGPAADGATEDMDAIVARERKVVGEIHDALINKHPPRLSDYEVEHLFKPGIEIAGDHFEYFRIDDDHLGVILLDTNVRGIPAALVMASARSYVRAAAPGNLSPAAVLKIVNRHLAGELPPGRHVTAVYAVIDTSQHKVTMASAGGLPVLVFRQASGKIAKVNPAGIAMGLDVGPVFDRELQEGDVPLGPGDRLALYTDGALHITNEAGEEYGEQRFYQSVAREAPKNSQAFVNFVGSAIDQFHVQTAQTDDVTISTVKRLR